MEIVTIVLRIVHIFSGVFWAGAAWIAVFFLEPTVRAMGPEGGKFMSYLASSRRYPFYISIAAVLTVLAGWALWFMRFGVPSLQTGPGLTLAIGGILGLAAAVVGGAVVGPASSRMAALGKEIAAGKKPPTPEQASQMAAFQARLRSGGVWTAILTTLALLTMAIARYV